MPTCYASKLLKSTKASRLARLKSSHGSFTEPVSPRQELRFILPVTTAEQWMNSYSDFFENAAQSWSLGHLEDHET